MKFFKKKKPSRGNNKQEIISAYMDTSQEEDHLLRMMAFVKTIQVPVSELCGLQSLVADMSSDSEIYDYSSTLNTCGILLADMIRNVRLYYTISSGLYDKHPVQYLLTTELEKIWRHRMSKPRNLILYRNPMESDLYMKFTVHPGVPTSVTGDKKYIKTIVHNLLDNATKFTLGGEVSIDLFMKNLEHDTAELNLTVKDSGIGIPIAAITKIFDPLVKCHSEIVDGGAGMGLTVSRVMCRDTGGDLILKQTCEEDNNGGSTFEATFFVGPCGKNFTTRETVFCHTYIAKKTLIKTSIFNNCKIDMYKEIPCHPRILVVDDVNIIRSIMSRMLSSLSIDTETSTDGTDAISKCKEFKYDVIFMDVHMPGISGLDACMEIRNTMNEKTPMVVLTGSFDTDLREHAERNEIDWLTKPIKQDTLYSTLTSKLEPSRIAWIKQRVEFDEN